MTAAVVAFKLDRLACPAYPSSCTANTNKDVSVGNVVTHICASDCNGGTSDVMILRSNLPRLCELAKTASRVLDVGGWYQPFNLATHVIDLLPFETRRVREALDPDNAERFSESTWVSRDVCDSPWPFPDRYFDFAFCSHLLEDVRDPLTVCRELCRVAKSGYIETPSRLREIYSKQRWFTLKSLFGNIPEIGFYHHRWFVEAEGSHLRFTPKTSAITGDRRRYLTRQQIGRKLTEQESGLGFFWLTAFTFEEVSADVREDYTRFGERALAALNTSPRASGDDGLRRVGWGGFSYSPRRYR